MSVQLEALADEVFGAAAAQNRAGAQTVRRPFGDVVSNPSFPDLFFLHGVVDLVAPEWRVDALERALQEAMPDVGSVRAHIRDKRTIATLGASLTAAGYHHEIRVAMVQVFTPHPDPPPQGGREIGRVDAPDRWVAFEELIKVDTAEHEWTPSMREQLIALYRWRADHTPTTYYVAMDGGRPTANVALFQHRSTAYLHGLFTRPDARRRGLGSALTRAMHGQMQALGCERLTLQCTDDGHLPAYYHRLGFRRVGEEHIWSKQQ